MRLHLALAALLLTVVGGCATTQTGPQPEQPLVYQDRPAAALAFDPPCIGGTPRLDLSRDGREVAAYVGFDEVTVSSYYLRVDDRQTNDGTDWYLRRGIIERGSVNFR